MQPVVGVIADNSRSKWGRRRPFMIGGSLIVGLCLLVLGWTSEIVSVVVKNPDTKSFWTITLAVLSIYAVDFAINAVQSSCRSLIIDTLPISKQPLGSAWASRMIAVGHLVGYGVGTLDLPRLFGPLFGETQFKQLTAIAAVVLVLAVSVTSYAVNERVLISSRDSDTTAGAIQMVTKIFKTTMHLPNRIQGICWIQFWAWIGWFPFLFYGPTWVGETYMRYSAPEHVKQSTDTLGEIGRIGSLSLVVFSIVTFAGSVLLPLLVESPEDEKAGFTPRPPPSVAPLIKILNKYRPDLLTAWMLSHLIFASAMFLAPFVQSLHFATILVSVCGIPWALACWAPFAFMGIEINRLTYSPLVPNPNHHSQSYTPLSSFTVEMTDTPSPSPQFLRLNHLDRDIDSLTSSSTGETAGIYLGILNLFTTLPQFVGTFISMIVFAVLEPGKEVEGAGGEGDGGKKKEQGTNAIAVCLFIGAMSSVVAAYATRRFKDVR
ncbi:hypothetical protein MMC14_000853 [Varicellaria rhodocarpa]|nr:hypothetical protein [Varicellaria rhodocarpa]